MPGETAAGGKDLGADVEGLAIYEDPINGYEYDNSTQFEFVGWPAIASPLGLTIAKAPPDPRAR